MKVLVIYANDCKEEVENLRNEISSKYGKKSVLRMNSKGRRKSIIKHAWHKDAIKMMKLADVIVYVLSENSIANKNVNWELNKAIKLNKYIVCIPFTHEKTEIVLNDCLCVLDSATKEETYLADMINSKEELFKLIDEYDSDSYIKLFNDEIDNQVLLEQYRLFSDTAENLVARRQNVNSFYISANTALITIAGTIFAIGSDGSYLAKIIVIFALTIPGILLNISWGKTLQSYFINNQGKMKILSMIEKRLSVSLYDAEWKAMKNKYSKKKYVSFTDNEKKLPIVFNVFYLIVAIVCCVSLVFLFLNKI